MPSFKKIDISNFGTKYHIDLAKFLTKNPPSIDDTFLINKINRVLKAIWFSEEMFEVTFNNINIKSGRIALLDKYLNANIYNAIDNIIVKDEGNYCLELIGPWIKLYTEWPEEHINVFAQLWNKYLANKLSIFMTDSNQFYYELYRLYKIVMSLFKLTIFKNIPIDVTTENLQRIINLLSLDRITRIAKSSNEHLLTLIKLNSVALDKLNSFIQYKACLKSSNYLDQDYEDVEVDKIIFIINFYYLIQNEPIDETTTLLTNSAIDDMFHETREILLNNYETFIKWQPNSLILFCNWVSSEHTQLEWDIAEINFDDVIVKDQIEYSILLKILKTNAAKMGVEMIRTFGFKFADQLNQCKMKSGNSLLDYLAKQLKSEEENLIDMIKNNDKDISKILNTLGLTEDISQTLDGSNLKRKSSNYEETENKRAKIEGKSAVMSPQSSSIAGPSSLYNSNVNTLFNEKPVVHKQKEVPSNDTKFTSQLRKS